MENYFQFIFTPAGCGEEGLFNTFSEMAKRHGFKQPKPLGHQHDYTATRVKPRMRLELMLPRGRVTGDKPCHQQYVCGMNVAYAARVPGPEACAIVEEVLTNFDVHVGGLNAHEVLLATISAMNVAGMSNPILSYESAVLPQLAFTAPPRPAMQPLYLWTYIGSAFYPTVVAALRANKYPEVLEAPKGVWIKVGQPTEDGAAGFAKLKQFWSRFWTESGLDRRTLPGVPQDGDDE